MKNYNGTQDHFVSEDDAIIYDYYDLLELNGNVTIHEKLEFSLPFKIVVYIMYNLVFVSALMGNLLVVYVVFFFPKMRTVTNYLIANLAIGDLLMAVLCVPFSYVVVLLQYWPFGETLCTVLPPAQAISVFVSAYTLVALAGDRYAAILYPLRPRLRRSQALVIIALVWVIALVTVIPIMMTQKYELDPIQNLTLCEEDWSNRNHQIAYSLTLMVLQYFFPLIVLIFTYTRIALAVWGKRPPGEAEGARDQRLARAKRKTVVMTLLVIAGYNLAWLPINILTLTFALAPEVTENYSNELRFVYFACHWLAMAHSTYNFFIYLFTNSKFRNAFYSVFCKICFCCPRTIENDAENHLQDPWTKSIAIHGHQNGSSQSRILRLRNNQNLSNTNINSLAPSPAVTPTNIPKITPANIQIKNNQLTPI